MKKKYYFTFGCGIDTPHRNCYHVEIAEDYGKAREQMVDKFGIDWLFNIQKTNGASVVRITKNT